MTRIQMLDKYPLCSTIMKFHYEQEGKMIEGYGVYKGYRKSSLMIIDEPKNRHWVPINHDSSIWVVDPEKLAECLSSSGKIEPQNFLVHLW
jgi:hypothetical protein